MSRRSAIRATLGVLLLLCVGTVWADYKSDYQDGIEAFEKGNWAEARRLMAAAVAANPTPAPRMRTYGTNFIPYVPYYYLGLASAQLGDCAGAVKAFKDSGSRNIVQAQAALAKAMAQQETRCQGLLAQVDAPKPPLTDTKPPVATTPAVSDGKPVVADTRPTTTVQPPVTTVPTTPTTTVPTPASSVALSEQRIAPAKTTLARINTQLSAIQRQLQSAPLAGTGDARSLEAERAKLRNQAQQVGGKLEQARLAGDTKLLAAVETDASALERALGMLGDRAQSAGEGIAQAQEAQALERSRKRAAAALASLDQGLASARSNGIGDTTAVKAAAELRPQLQQAVTGTDRAAIDQLLVKVDGTSRQLDQAIAAAPKPAPEPLRAVVGLYLAGRYTEAAAWNDLERLPDARARAQARLIRAAASLHLYVRGGEQDGNLIAAVDSDLREAKRLDRALKPNLQAFSPKLVERFATQ